MKIAVTGHLGTIGRPLVLKLRAAGHEVFGIDLQHSADAQSARADIADYRQLEAAMPKDVELVYHLAAEFGRYNGEHFYEQLWRTNATGTKNMLTLQKQRGYKMIFASSSEVYGERPETVLNEQLVLSPFYLSNDYAVSKLVNETQIVNAEKQWGAECMRLRFFNAYGPGEHYHSYRSVVCLFGYRALHGLPYTVYEGYYRVFQYIDDLVQTLVNAATAFRPGLVANVAGTEYISVRELHERLNEIVKVDPALVTFLPEEKHNVVSKKPDIYIAQKILGHDPKVKLEHGLARTINWLQRKYG